MNAQNGLASDIKSARQKFSDFWRTIFGEKKDFNKVAYMNNPESIGDEMLILFWIVVGVASCFTFFYGFKYHLSIFEGNGDSEALAISTAVFVVGEILKVMVGHRFFRSVFSGLFAKGLAQLFLVIGMGVLSYFAYEWSVGISAKGYAAVMANKSKKEAVAKTGNYGDIEKAYNSQIAEAQKTVDAGRKVTWAGKVTWEGQQMMKQGNKIIAKLNEDKQSAINAAKQKDASTLALDGELIQAKQTQQNDYGGKAEQTVAFCLLLICLIEVINYRQFQKKEMGTSTAKVTESKPFGLTPRLSPTAETEERPKIGFQYGAAQSVKSVITEQKVVITEKSKQTDDLIAEAFRKKIQGLNSECSHYENQNGTLDRIVKRIKEKCETIMFDFREHEGVLPQSVIDNYKKAMERCVAIIQAHKEGTND